MLWREKKKKHKKHVVFLWRWQWQTWCTFFFLLRGSCVSVFLWRGSCGFFIYLFFIYFFYFLRFRFKGNREKRSDHGSQNRAVESRFERLPAFLALTGSWAYRTVTVRGSRFFRSDRTVRSGFQNLGCSASPKIGEIATSQVSHMMIATLVIVLVKLLERDQSNRNSFPQFQVQVCLPLWQLLHCCLDRKSVV